MSASVFVFPSRGKGPQPWTNEELAELYRVVEILGRAGLAVETDMGMSEDGDPWFVFCRADSGEVIAHFARIDGQFVAASIAVDETYKGANFRQIVDRMVESQPLILPPPNRGTRLLLHPSVILTAFVATALAHSEKMVAADALRPVEAKWDHAPAAADAPGVGKHAKGSWFESLQAMLKAPLGDNKGGHDMAAGQGLSLASLIAIAMTAMQPVVDKLAFVTQAMADEVKTLTHPVPQSHGDHAVLAATDMPVVDADAVKASDAIVVAADADQTASQQKLPADVTQDSQKTVVDTVSHSLAPAAVQKAAADDTAHVAPPATADYQTEANVTELLLLAQKTAQAPVAEATVHTDGSSASPIVISFQDINPQALQLLSIHLDDGSTGAESTAQKVGGSETPSHDQGGSSGAVAPAPATSASGAAPAPVGPTVFDVAATNGSDVINAIDNFATSGLHDFAAPVTVSAGLQQELAPYLTTGQNVKLVVFESSVLTVDVMEWAPGVIFVNEKTLPASAVSTNSGGNLVLDMPNGGSVTLVGVATLDHHPVA